MSTRMEPYKNADLIGSVSGIITVPDSPNSGKFASAQRFRSMASLGYKSKYNQIEKQWVVLSIEGQEDHTYSYTGKNIVKLETIWASICRTLKSISE